MEVVEEPLNSMRILLNTGKILFLIGESIHGKAEAVYRIYNLVW